MRNLEEIKADLAKSERMLEIATKQNAPQVVMKNAESKVEKFKAELAELESKAEKAVDKAEGKLDDAETKAEKKEAAKEVKEAKEEVKKVEKVAQKAEKVAEKVEDAKAKAKKIIGRMEKPKSTWGGAGRGAGRKPKAKPVVKKTMVAPKDVKVEKMAISKRKAKAVAKAKAEAPTKVKKVRAFGQVIEYRNDAEFCSKLKAAFKKRRAASKADGKRRKTKPVFGIITTNIKNAVSKAINNVPTKEIEKNPKQFLVKAERLEKSAIRFLEDFKSILGNDYKKSEIEFSEIEKLIKKVVAKVTK